MTDCDLWTVAHQAPLSLESSRQAIPFSRGIFLTQGSNPGLLHWRQILYHLRHQGRLEEPVGPTAKPALSLSPKRVRFNSQVHVPCPFSAVCVGLQLETSLV